MLRYSKSITFAVPCYNSAAYMDTCIESILKCGDDIEIIIVDDGSTKDDTAQKADEWAERYPSIIRAIHQENAGHGGAVNTGLANARGRYFKVVDSDDWLDADAMEKVMAYIRPQCELHYPTDLVVANYVYEKVHENKRTVHDSAIVAGLSDGNMCPQCCTLIRLLIRGQKRLLSSEL